MTIEIYGLIDPVSGEIRYVGKANNSNARLKNHLSESRRKTPVYRWIDKLRTLGMQPSMVVLEVCRPDNWQEAEIRLIAEYRNRGNRMLNVAAGGDEPYCSKEVRANNARINSRSRVDTPLKRRIYNLKREIGQALIKGYVSEESKEKIRYAATIKPEWFGSLLVRL
jgi:hypothetical protein